MKELVPDAEPVEGLGDFFDSLWGDQQGYVYLPNKDKNLPPEDAWKKVMFQWPQDRTKVINYTLATNAKGRDVYFAPALFKEPRPIRDNVLGTYYCWVDFDGNAPEAWHSTVPAEAPSRGMEDLNRLEATAPPPTFRICSSKPGYEHVYWRFKEFQTDLAFIENTNRALAYKYKADTSGWDLNQVLRPPFTTNFKHDLPVRVESATIRTYGNEDFAGFKKVKQVVSESIEIGEVPKPEAVIAKYPFDEHNWDLFSKAEVEEGKRSSALMAIGYFGAESGMSDEEIYSLLINADDRWGKFKHRSDRQKRLLDIINRARQKHPVGKETVENTFRGLLSSAENVEEGPQYVYGFQDFNNLDIPIDWIIEGLLERKGAALIASAPGVGKTQVSLHFCICAALGKRFLEWDIERPQKIMMFSLEMNASALQFFTQKMAKAYTEEEMALLQQNLLIVPLGETLPLDHPEGKQFFEALLEENQPDGVVLDSLGKVTNSSLSNEEKAKELNAYYARIRNKFDIFMWFIHHNRKANGDNKKPKNLEDIYGSQYVTTDLTTAFSLWRDEGGLELSTIKTRLAAEQSPLIIKRNEYLGFEVSEVTDPSFAGLVKEVRNDSSDRDPLYDM